MPKITVGEIELYYEQNGEGEPLILIPGFSAGIWIWFRQTSVLAQNFQVVTFDPRGVARSDKPEGPQTIRLIADDVASLAILMGNVPEWPISDLGTIMAGGVGVGLYPSSSAEQYEYIIGHSGAQFLLVDTAAQLEKVLGLRDRLPELKTIIALDASLAGSDSGVISYQDFINRGRAAREQFDSLLHERSEKAQLDDIAIMVYTSGTTGPPKGACISHRYILNSVESLRQTIPLFETDVSFSYLSRWVGNSPNYAKREHQSRAV